MYCSGETGPDAQGGQGEGANGGEVAEGGTVSWDGEAIEDGALEDGGQRGAKAKVRSVNAPEGISDPCV